jgi:hypothetical protein
MKSELDMLWESPPYEKKAKYIDRHKEIHEYPGALDTADQELKDNLMNKFNNLLLKYKITEQPEDWLLERMLENIVGHKKRYKTFEYEEKYMQDVVSNIAHGDHKENIKLLKKTKMSQWNKWRRWSVNICKLAESDKS